MVKVGWGASLITLELGVLIELPPPIRIVILGRLSLVLPDKDSPVLSLNVDILGIIEFDRGEMSLDMRLFDSRLVAFVLTGEMALRLGWGGQPHFELVAGGFHPRFQPPAGFPSLERFALTLADSDNPRLRAETYFALTSNSLQLGARLDFHVHVDIAVLGLLSVDAYLGFDVLIRFSPFSLEADIGASVTLKRNGKPIFAIDSSCTSRGLARGTDGAGRRSSSSASTHSRSTSRSATPRRRPRCPSRTRTRSSRPHSRTRSTGVRNCPARAACS